MSHLATSSPTTTSITLTWTAPGDDGNTGTATTYDVRYRTGGAVDSSNWAGAGQATGEPTPHVAGTGETFVVSGLSSSTVYYFALETADEVPNWSAISNSPSGTTSTPADTTPPATVSNLATSSPTTTSLPLTWTAPGDDGNTGTATTYDVRYRTGGAVVTTNWAGATQARRRAGPARNRNRRDVRSQGSDRPARCTTSAWRRPMRCPTGARLATRDPARRAGARPTQRLRPQSATSHTGSPTSGSVTLDLDEHQATTVSTGTATTWNVATRTPAGHGDDRLVHRHAGRPAGPTPRNRPHQARHSP